MLFLPVALGIFPCSGVIQWLLQRFLSLQKFAQNLDGLEQHISRFVANEMAVFEQFESKMDSIVQASHQAIGRLTQTADSVTQDTRGVQEAVGRIMYSLQFQDLTRQILEHVQTDIDRMVCDMRQVAGVQAVSIDALATIVPRYTMASERDVYAAATGTKVSSKATDEITFF